MSSAAPVVGAFAEEVAADIAPLQYADPQNAYALLTLIGALGAMFQPLRDMGRADSLGNPGWSQLLDITRCPTANLPYLGQFVGVGVNTALTDAGQRAQIQAESAMQRGTPAAIRAAAQQYLTGSQTVQILERTTDAYNFTVVTYTSETPAADWTENIVANGGFESNITGWSVSGIGSSISRSSTEAMFGSYSLEAAMGTHSDDLISTQPASGQTLQAGIAYTFSAYVYLPLGISATISIVNDTTTQTNSLGFTGTGGWQHVSVTQTPTANSPNNDVTLEFNWVSATGYIDGVQMQQGATATTYIDTNGTIAIDTTGTGPVAQALAAAKPAGLILTYIVVTGQIWQQVIDNNATWADVISTYPTWADLINNTP